MYYEYFGLKEMPFSIAPDPRYLYMSEKHREALAHLLYGVKSDNGFVLLTGEVGTGKTTVCRCFLEQVPENTDIAFILNPKVTVTELLAALCDELGISYVQGNDSIKVFVDHINRYLLEAHARGRNTVLIIEESQNLSTDVMEQIRLLTNLETNNRKLLQIIMVGQPELKELLSRPHMRQLSQRITARYHLGALSKNEIASYLAHRLSVAGGQRTLFPPSTIDKLYALSGGIPRIINLLCDRALLGAYAQGKETVDKKTLVKAADEVLGEINDQKVHGSKLAWALVLLLYMVLGGVISASYLNYISRSTPLIMDVPQGDIPVAEAANKKTEINKLLWPESQPMDKSKELAYKALFTEWEVPLVSQNPDRACTYAETEGLKCLKKTGSLAFLEQLNRPAILRLEDDQGRTFFGTVTKFHNETVTLVLGDKTMVVDMSDLVMHWFGDFIVVWRMPPHYTKAVQLGHEGPETQWIEEKLTAFIDRDARAKHRLFDEQLTREIKQFQLAEGLLPDGIAGPVTIMHINTRAGTAGPRLVAVKGTN
jgi:general secretion pathway protein A